MRGKRRGPGGWTEPLAGRYSLRPDLRTGNSDGGRTSYWQGPGQTRQKTARTVSRALRGSPSICVTRSKVRPQANWRHGIFHRFPQGPAHPVPLIPALILAGLQCAVIWGWIWSVFSVFSIFSIFFGFHYWFCF